MERVWGQVGLSWVSLVAGCWVLRDKHQPLRVLLSSSHHALPFLAPTVGQDMPRPLPRALLPLFKT